MLKPHIPSNSMAHDIFYTPNPVAFYHPCFQRRQLISTVHRVVTGLRIFTHCVCERVCVQGGERGTGVAERRNQRQRSRKKKEHPKYIEVSGYVCLLNVTFIIWSQQDTWSDRSGNTNIGFCLHRQRILKTWYGGGLSSCCNRKSMDDIQPKWQ